MKTASPTALSKQAPALAIARFLLVQFGYRRKLAFTLLDLEKATGVRITPAVASRLRDTVRGRWGFQYYTRRDPDTGVYVYYFTKKGKLPSGA